MLRNTVLWVTIVALLNLTFVSCRQHMRIHHMAEVKDSDRITSIVFPSGKVMTFESPGARYIRGNIITGLDKWGTPVYISNMNAITRVTIRVHASNTTENFETRVIQVRELAENADVVIHSIGQVGKQIEFDDTGGRYLQDIHLVHGIAVGEGTVEIPLDDILYVNVSRSTGAGRLLAFVGALTLAFVIGFILIVLTKESCPFVYSYDGEKYVFDAEPLGGAIAEGLARTEYSRLEHLRPDDGRYHLLFRNEVEEIQYLDEVKLAIIDYDTDAAFYSDFLGDFHTVKTPQLPTVAVEEHGRDLLPFLNEVDGISWQTHFPEVDSDLPETHRHQLDLTFPKPEEASTARLIVNAGTGLWGSNMIREMLQLRGDKVDDWYAAINRGEDELIELMHFIEREELFLLKVNVLKNGRWEAIEAITASGPLITETRVVPLDLRGIEGDSLKIRLNPPAGYWTIDHLAIEYEDYAAPHITEITPIFGEGDYADSVTTVLANKDGQHQMMYEVGDEFRLSFEVPELAANQKRAIYLKTHGYYEIVIDQSQPERTALIEELMTTPGLITAYSMQEYQKWREHQFAQIKN